MAVDSWSSAKRVRRKNPRTLTHECEENLTYFYKKRAVGPWVGIHPLHKISKRVGSSIFSLVCFLVLIKSIRCRILWNISSWSIFPLDRASRSWVPYPVRLHSTSLVLEIFNFFSPESCILELIYLFGIHICALENMILLLNRFVPVQFSLGHAWHSSFRCAAKAVSLWISCCQHPVFRFAVGSA